jgi:hypothetical protein
MARWARWLEVVVVVMMLGAGGYVRGRVIDHWAFAGSDSYRYLELGHELVRSGRFALAPPPQPLEWYRRPLYPLFAVLAAGGAPATMSGGDGWRRIELAQCVLDLLGTGLLVFFAARRISGRLGGLVALALAMFYPPSVLYVAAALTESLSMLLTIAAVAPLFWADTRPRVAFVLGGIGVALAALLRPDGPILAIAMLPALAGVVGWRRRAELAGWALGAFLLVFGFWPARNLVQFGKLHLSDGMVDRLGHDVPNYLGFWRWIQTWAPDSRAAGYPQSCFYDSHCPATLELYDREEAFEAPGTSVAEERARVRELLQLRQKEGISPRVSDGFMALARARRQRHPWRVTIGLPASRAWALWTSPQDELLQNPNWWPWRQLAPHVIPHFRMLAKRLFWATVVALGLLLALRRTRRAALTLALPLVARTAVLAWTAFSLPRYLACAMPLTFVAIGAGTAVLAGLIFTWGSRQWQQRRAAKAASA